MIRRCALLLLCIAALIGLRAGAQSPDTIYDETKVPQYSLPDPLVMKSGFPICRFHIAQKLFSASVPRQSGSRPQTMN